VHVLTVCPGVIRTPFFDEEALSRMAPAAKRGMVEVDGLVDAITAALAKGKHEITYPGGIAPAYAIQAIAPEFMRKQVKRSTIDALAKARGR
jgi:short-subunit dehydrogenase